MNYNSTNFAYCIGLSSSRYVKSFSTSDSISFVLRGVDVLIDTRDGSIVAPKDSFAEHLNKKYISKEDNSFYKHFFFTGEVVFTFEKSSIFYDGYAGAFIHVLSELVSDDNPSRHFLFDFGFAHDGYYDEFSIQSDNDNVMIEFNLNEFQHDLTNPITHLQELMTDDFLSKKLKLRKK